MWSPQSFTKSLSNGFGSSSMPVGYPQGWIVAKLYGAGHHLKAALRYAGMVEWQTQGTWV